MNWKLIWNLVEGFVRDVAATASHIIPVPAWKTVVKDAAGYSGNCNERSRRDNEIQPPPSTNFCQQMIGFSARFDFACNTFATRNWPVRTRLM